MKSSYKYLGELWNNLKESNTISYINDDQFINDIDEDYNLFDYSGIRKINISKILKIEKEKNIEQLLKRMSQYKSIIIIMDFIPNNNPIIIKFFIKRIKQILYYFDSHLGNTKIYLSNEFKELID